MKYIATINGKKYEIEVERIDPYPPLSRGERLRQKEGAKEEGLSAVKEKNQGFLAEAHKASEEEAQKRGGERKEKSGGERSIESPLVGKIVRVLVQNGQQVKAGETLLVIEALKMETEIVAPVAGRVFGIAVEAGQQVEAGTGLLAIG